MKEAFEEVGMSIERCVENECLGSREAVMSCTICYVHGTESECEVCRENADIIDDSIRRSSMACNICLFHGTSEECEVCRDWLDIEYESD